jgi:hypothetical protein
LVILNILVVKVEQCNFNGSLKKIVKIETLMSCLGCIMIISLKKRKKQFLLGTKEDETK